MTDKKPNDIRRTELAWLADAPLFIDREQIERFYDAVVRPESETLTTTLEVTDQRATDIRAKLEVEATASSTPVAALLAPFFAFLKVSAKASGEGEIKNADTATKKNTVQLRPINNAERQLEHLAFHYLINHTERLALVADPASSFWREPRFIQEVPRALVFLDLKPGVKLIPTAAELVSGEIRLLYKDLDFGPDIPDYPEPKGHLNEDGSLNNQSLRSARIAYWEWFSKRFSATKAMHAIEAAASKGGGLRWIDYRLPVSKEGDTLHLHVRPSGNYPAGTFAYNFVKRGEKHGLRLVGTLKSEPDMNVLAIYDK